MTALEALTNATIGLVVSWVATFWLLPPLFGIAPSAGQSTGITALFFALSFVRGYVIRKVFKKWQS